MRRFAACARKSLVEALRDWKITAFALLFAPAFVVAMSGYLGHGNKPFVVGVVAADRDAGMLARLRASRYDDGVPHFTLRFLDGVEAGLARIGDRSLDALLEIPAGFDVDAARAVDDPGAPIPRVRLHGDPRNARYTIAAILVYAEFDLYVRRLSRSRPPAEMDERLVGQGRVLTEFDLMVPGLVVFALLNALLTAGAAFLREVDRGTMIRLALSKLRPSEFIGAVSLVQAAVCVASALLALLVSLACGFSFQGTVGSMVVVASLSSISIVGVALLTAASLRTVHDLLTVGVAPYFAIMFFSGLMFPLPPSVLLKVGTRVVRVEDLVPLASSVTAFNRVMNDGAGLGAIAFDLALIAVVGSAWFAVGLWAFRRRHMNLAG